MPRNRLEQHRLDFITSRVIAQIPAKSSLGRLSISQIHFLIEATLEEYAKWRRETDEGRKVS